MDWKDLGARVIGLGAPLLGEALGVPLGAAAGRILADALGAELYQSYYRKLGGLRIPVPLRYLIQSVKTLSFLIRKKPDAASRIGEIGRASRQPNRDSSLRFSGQFGVLPPGM